MKDQEFDILLNKFIEETISSDELVILKRSEKFESYQKILNATSEFKTPTIKVEDSYAAFLQKTVSEKKEQKPVIKLKRSYIISGVAASLILLLGLFQFLNFDQTFKTNYGEQLSVFLPDSSEVVLNASSSIKFNEKKWKKDRLVNLEGEAFFKVKKGSKFKVVTNEGTVSVLGTQFNVNEYADFLEVQCFEGKVLVERNGNEEVLTKGKAVRQIQNKEFEKWTFINEKPSWKNYETNFNNTPLIYIIENFKKTYGVEVIVEKIDLEKRFSGSFPNKDIKIALETISNSMNLDYSIKNKKVILRTR